MCVCAYRLMLTIAPNCIVPCMCVFVRMEWRTDVRSGRICASLCVTLSVGLTLVYEDLRTRLKSCLGTYSSPLRKTPRCHCVSFVLVRLCARTSEQIVDRSRMIKRSSGRSSDRGIIKRSSEQSGEPLCD